MKDSSVRSRIQGVWSPYWWRSHLPSKYIKYSRLSCDVAVREAIACARTAVQY